MNWLFFALLAPAIYTVTNFIDKYLLESKVKDYRGMPIYSGIAGLIFSLCIWIFHGLTPLSFSDGLLIILTGVFNILALAIYFEVLSKEETSTVIILFQLTPVLNLLLAFLFLGEIITVTQILGFGLVLLATVGASIKFEKKKLKFSKSLIFLLGAEVLWALSNILFKFVSKNQIFSSLLTYEGFGFTLGGILLVLTYSAARKAFVKNFREAGRKVLSVILINEAFYILARIFTYLALTLAPVAMVSIIGSTQVFFGIMYAIVLTVLFPRIFKEDISKATLQRKLILALIAFIGIFFVSS